MLFHYCSCEHNDCGYSVFLLATTTELKRLNNYTAYVYLLCAVMKKKSYGSKHEYISHIMLGQLIVSFYFFFW